MEVERASTVKQFCDDFGICKSTFYAMKAAGTGPKTIRIGRAVRITHQARSEWVEKQTARAETTSGAARSAAWPYHREEV